jgi:hypothetical protein
VPAPPSILSEAFKESVPAVNAVTVTKALKVSLPEVPVVPPEPTKTPDISAPVVSGQVRRRDKYLIFKDFL